MKNLTKFLAISLLVIVVSMSFASCGFIKDIVNNAINSEEEGTAISIDEAKERLENNGYYVNTYVLGETTSTSYSSDTLESCSILYAYGYGTIIVRFFNNKSDADAYYEEIKDNWEYSIYSGYDTSEMSCGQKGKIVYVGSNDAIDILFGNN